MIFVFVFALIFALGPLLGPIGLMIALTTRGNQTPCPACEEFVHPDATKCPHCSVDIVRPEVLPTD